MIKKGEICPTCERYYDRHVVVDGVVIKGEEILLIRRGIEPGKGMMALPGGYLNWNETIEEAVVREVFEETGVKTKIVHLLGVYSSPDREPRVMQNVAVVYVLEVVDDTEMKAQESEVAEVTWYSENSLPENMAFDHREIIADYLRKKRT